MVKCKTCGSRAGEQCFGPTDGSACPAERRAVAEPEHGIDGALRLLMLDPEYVSTATCKCGETFSATNFTIIDANEDALSAASRARSQPVIPLNLSNEQDV